MGPSNPRTGSTICEAKYVFTITLTCTAALPRIAGPIMLMMCRIPGCDKLERRAENKSVAAQYRHLHEQLQQTPHDDTPGHALQLRNAQRGPEY